MGSYERSGGGAAIQPEVEMRAAEFVVVQGPAGEKGQTKGEHREKRFLDFLRARPSREWLLKFGFSGKLGALSFPRSGPTPAPSRRRYFRVSFVRKIDWNALKIYAKKWIKDPLNMALLVWLAAVVVVFAIMLFISIGLLNSTIPESSQRKNWVEVCNQILNALFTIMCVYQYPKLLHHLVLVLRWSFEDAAALRRSYSKKGIVRPHERLHIAFVLFLLHLTCFAQFGLCGLYWGYSRSSRPDYAVNICFCAGIIAPIVAAVYTLYGPSGGRSRPSPTRNHRAMKLNESRIVVTRPEWVGGLFDCWDDMTVAYLSFFCTFCVFGWNMERLGFGNMYVHIFTFVLLIVTPFWVFNVAGLNIADHGVREAVGIVGILLCFLGLLYGAPSNYFCWGYPNLTDFMQWLFCWSCALAQEVRTGNFYDIEEGSFYSKNSSLDEETEEEEGVPPSLHPLPAKAARCRRLRGPSSSPDLLGSRRNLRRTRWLPLFRHR
ncbi:unnamed protein product [Spirodela intermedia]|uniref:Uncharacterized protein n=1 Tax=Spirodela intermedia TaxID=51605 RepID=A0A7I8IVL2_SPIIN|nr:unnamed protein product [Spirodela intermedia]CAA6661859.1 unnamed protein product [Spirodela intermedia]